jgi:hypothetical protein
MRKNGGGFDLIDGLAYIYEKCASGSISAPF